MPDNLEQPEIRQIFQPSLLVLVVLVIARAVMLALPVVALPVVVPVVVLEMILGHAVAAAAAVLVVALMLVVVLAERVKTVAAPEKTITQPLLIQPQKTQNMALLEIMALAAARMPREPQVLLLYAESAGSCQLVKSLIVKTLFRQA
jgi:hypothetical protein